jgi:hypothetical protein
MLTRLTAVPVTAVAAAVGCLQQSKIGAGNAAAAAGAGSVNVYGARRTSSSLLMEPATQVSRVQEAFGG